MVQPLTRYAGGGNRLGLLDGALNARLESVSGYAALPIQDYLAYRRASRRNPKLNDGLNVSVLLEGRPAALVSNPSALPRAYFPKAIRDVGDAAQAIRELESLDPHEGSIVTAPHEPVRQDSLASATIVFHDERRYRIRYRAASPSLLRLSVPYYPGWRASVNGGPLAVVRVDAALMGVVVPAGDGEVDFEFRPDTFRTGAATDWVALKNSCAIIVPSWGPIRPPLCR